MKLEDKTEYLNGRGECVIIMGETKHHKEYVWSLQGDWYIRATGQRLGYRIVRDENGRDVGGEHFPYNSDCLSVAKKVGPYSI